MPLYHKNLIIYTFVCIFILLCINYNICFASDGDNASNTFYYVQTTAKDILKDYKDKVTAYADLLFMALSLIGLVITLSSSLLTRSDNLTLDILLWPLLRFVLIVGFVYFILNNIYPLLIKGLLTGFKELGVNISGFEFDNPSQFLDVGMTKADELFAKAYNCDSETVGGVVALACIFFAAVFMICCFVVLAFSMLIVCIFFYFLAYGAIFFVGFFGWDETRDYAVAYLKLLLSQAVTYYGMIIFAGIIYQLLDTVIADFDTNAALANANPCMAICIVSYAMLKMCQQVPQKLGELISEAHVHTYDPVEVFKASMFVTLGGAALSIAATSYVGGAVANNQTLRTVGRKTYQYSRKQIKRLFEQFSPEASSTMDRGNKEIEPYTKIYKKYTKNNNSNETESEQHEN